MKINPGLLVLGGVAAVGAYLAYGQFSGADRAPARAAPEEEIAWIAAAPARAEPKSGEIRIGTGILGRVIKVHAAVDEKVEEGELIVQLDDAEARARLTSAETQAEALREEREKAFASGREDVRKAEDAIYSAERAVTGARIELDGALIAKHTSPGSEQSVAEARKRLTEANERLERERLAFIRAQSKANLPAPSSAESAVSAARTEVRLAEALLDKTRIRAPLAGTVLQVNAKAGEIVAPNPEVPLIVMGDMSSIRVKAEVDEGDISKITVGQKVFVRSLSFPGKEFDGTVASLAPTLAQPRIGPRGPKRPNDVEVREVTIDLDVASPLLPGMRVDAFFRK
jgi:HlyD family secretion protein